MKITSAALLWLGWLCGAQAQDNSNVLPRFVPAPTRDAGVAVPAHFTEPNPPAKSSKITPTAAQGPDKGKIRNDFDDDFINLPLDLPGPQGLFRRESEASFYTRIGQSSPKGRPAIFPAEVPVSKETYKQRNFPPQVAQVEPLFLLHRRLLFEQPNFERGLWDFGILQPGISLGAFYYNVAMMPYHHWSDMRDRSDGNLGKCLPGDQTPLRVPIERFSVTGAIGEVGVIIGGGYLFP